MIREVVDKRSIGRLWAQLCTKHQTQTILCSIYSLSGSTRYFTIYYYTVEIYLLNKSYSIFAQAHLSTNAIFGGIHSM